jgi:hypothetical protein
MFHRQTNVGTGQLAIASASLDNTAIMTQKHDRAVSFVL